MTWFDKLSDATTSMFAKRKGIVEDQLNLFYYNEDLLVDNGYIRSVVYFFRRGDTDILQPGNYLVKAVVEHHFRTEKLNMTFDYFKTWHGNRLKQTQGKLSEDFNVDKFSVVSSKFFL